MTEHPFQLIASQGSAEVVKAVAQGRQFDFAIRLPGLCTDGVHAVVGQHEMGQAAQVEVTQDCFSMNHLVITQPQRTAQLFEQDLDVPRSPRFPGL